MLTALLVLLAVATVFGAGEAVRGQCRRMLSGPASARIPEPVPGDAVA
jgi:hypothetical protein